MLPVIGYMLPCYLILFPIVTLLATHVTPLPKTPGWARECSQTLIKRAHFVFGVITGTNLSYVSMIFEQRNMRCGMFL